MNQRCEPFGIFLGLLADITTSAMSGYDATCFEVIPGSCARFPQPSIGPYSHRRRRPAISAGLFVGSLRSLGQISVLGITHVLVSGPVGMLGGAQPLPAGHAAMQWIPP